jgi:hypothetical protein
MFLRAHLLHSGIILTVEPDLRSRFPPDLHM